MPARDTTTARAHTNRMTLPGGGPIVGYAIVKAYGHEQEAAAGANDAAADRVALDDAELREVEYESMGLTVPVPAESSAPRSFRSLLRRIVRR